MILATPDILSSARLADVTSRLRGDLDRAALEAVTGRRSDVTRAANGQLGQVHRAHRAVETSDAVRTRLALVTGRYAQGAAALRGVREATEGIGLEALTNATAGERSGVLASAGTARSTLGAVFSALNTRSGGRSLFAGAAAGQPALAPPAEVLAEVDALLTARPDAASKRAALSAYFAPGGGFDARYTGAGEDAAPVVLPSGLELPPFMRADTQGIRDLVQGLVVVAHAVELPPMEVAAWVRQGTDLIRAGRDALVGEEARLGLSLTRLGEAVAKEADAELVAARTLDRITGRDAFEAASETQGLETRLEAAYTLTSRLGRLSLTNYLR